MLHFLFRVKPEKIAADLLYEARRALVEHEAQAEHSTAMVTMLRGRIARLDPRTAPTEAQQQAALVAMMGVDGAASINAMSAHAQYDPARNAAPEYFNPANQKAKP